MEKFSAGDILHWGEGFLEILLSTELVDARNLRLLQIADFLGLRGLVSMGVGCAT